MVFLHTITVIVGVAVLSRGIIEFFLFFFFVRATLFFVTEGPMEVVVHCTRKWGRGSRQSVPDRCHFIGDIASRGSEFHGLVLVWRCRFSRVIFVEPFDGLRGVVEVSSRVPGFILVVKPLPPDSIL
jgi:hypothetical protein